MAWKECDRMSLRREFSDSRSRLDVICHTPVICSDCASDTPKRASRRTPDKRRADSHVVVLAETAHLGRLTCLK